MIAPDSITLGCPECSTAMIVACYSDRGLEGAFTATCGGCGYEMHVPETAKARKRIEALRSIVREHQAKRIDGFLVDAQTANALVTVYAALSPENRERFGKPPLDRLVDLAWKAVTPAT